MSEFYQLDYLGRGGFQVTFGRLWLHMPHLLIEFDQIMYGSLY